MKHFGLVHPRKAKPSSYIMYAFQNTQALWRIWFLPAYLWEDCDITAHNFARLPVLKKTIIIWSFRLRQFISVISITVYLSLSLYIYIDIYIYKSFHNLSIDQFQSVHICLGLSISIYLSISVCIHLFQFVWIYLSISLCSYLSIYLSVGNFLIFFFFFIYF